MNSIGVDYRLYNFAHFPEILNNLDLSLKMLLNRKVARRLAEKTCYAYLSEIPHRLKKMCKHYQRNRKNVEKMQI